LKILEGSFMVLLKTEAVSHDTPDNGFILARMTIETIICKMQFFLTMLVERGDP
jgi:hypothetical protein